MMSVISDRNQTVHIWNTRYPESLKMNDCSNESLDVRNQLPSLQTAAGDGARGTYVTK